MGCVIWGNIGKKEGRKQDAAAEDAATSTYPVLKYSGASVWTAA
jgi:hypothetical protein